MKCMVGREMWTGINCSKHILSRYQNKLECMKWRLKKTLKVDTNVYGAWVDKEPKAYEACYLQTVKMNITNLCWCDNIAYVQSIDFKIDCVF